MSVAFFCHCGQKLRVPGELASKRIKCPTCDQIMVVPERSTRPSTQEPEPGEATAQSAEMPALRDTPAPRDTAVLRDTSVADSMDTTSVHESLPQFVPHETATPVAPKGPAAAAGSTRQLILFGAMLLLIGGGTGWYMHQLFGHSPSAQVQSNSPPVKSAKEIAEELIQSRINISNKVADLLESVSDKQGLENIQPVLANLQRDQAKLAESFENLPAPVKQEVLDRYDDKIGAAEGRILKLKRQGPSRFSKNSKQQK